MKRILLFAILIYCAVIAAAQSFTLKGRVIDENMAPLELATVSVLKQGQI